ncbi:uncharacterized protein LOC142774407 [Rhipicephalus microplus]|uniref:uncharacterized protein LOC142774407 n=1 Tax=Rhipicephalus microplus TaxID=6941 RepID=UPI003F6AFE87
MLAFGILNFLGFESKKIFSEIFKDAMDNKAADIIVPLSTVSTIERQADCFSFPPGMWDLKTLTPPASNEAGFVTDLKFTTSMMDKTKTYNTSSQMGFSIELGTLGYLLTKQPASTTMAGALVMSKCDRFFLTSMDAMPCQADYIKKKVFPDVNLAFAESNRSYIFLYEDEDSIKYKAQKLKELSTNLRDNMVLLLVDVNLGNFIKGCSLRSDDAFSRISVAKTEFGVK